MRKKSYYTVEALDNMTLSYVELLSRYGENIVNMYLEPNSDKGFVSWVNDSYGNTFPGGKYYITVTDDSLIKENIIGPLSKYRTSGCLKHPLWTPEEADNRSICVPTKIEYKTFEELHEAYPELIDEKLKQVVPESVYQLKKMYGNLVDSAINEFYDSKVKEKIVDFVETKFGKEFDIESLSRYFGPMFDSAIFKMFTEKTEPYFKNVKEILEYDSHLSFSNDIQKKSKATLDLIDSLKWGNCLNKSQKTTISEFKEKVIEDLIRVFELKRGTIDYRIYGRRIQEISDMFEQLLYYYFYLGVKFGKFNDNEKFDLEKYVKDVSIETFLEKRFNKD